MIFLSKVYSFFFILVKCGKNFPTNVDYFIKVIFKQEGVFKTQPQKAQNPHWSETGVM